MAVGRPSQLLAFPNIDSVFNYEFNGLSNSPSAGCMTDTNALEKSERRSAKKRMKETEIEIRSRKRFAGSFVKHEARKSKLQGKKE